MMFKKRKISIRKKSAVPRYGQLNQRPIRYPADPNILPYLLVNPLNVIYSSTW